MGRGFRKMIFKWITKLVLVILYLGNFINTALIKSYNLGLGRIPMLILGGVFALHF